LKTYTGRRAFEEKVFNLIFNFIQNFNSVIDVQFQKDYIFFEIRPFERINKFYFKLKTIDELKEIKKIAKENQIRLISSPLEEDLLNKNPHLKKVLVWENFLTEDILYSNYFPNHRVSLFLEKLAPECGIIKEKSLDAWHGINYLIEGHKLINYLAFDNLSKWKEMVISNKNFWYLIDHKEKEKENARKKNSSKIYENPEKSSMDALSDGLPNDFRGSLEEAKRYLGLD